MTKPSQVFFSNRVEQLYETLKESLFSSSQPFTRRLIVVPSPSMKSWLMLRMANDPDLAIAAGLEISYLDQTIDQLSLLYTDTKQKKNHSQMTLAFGIEAKIRTLIAEAAILPSGERTIWQPLFDYLKIPHQSKGAKLSQHTERRIVGLCDRLAGLFVKYGKYAGPMLAEWESAPLDGWQQHLWRYLFSKPGLEWTYPHKELTRVIENPYPENEKKDLQIHLFAVSHISPLQQRLLKYVSGEFPVHYYMLSPCQAFWSDLVSQRESYRMQTYWNQRGASLAQQIALEEYLRDCNPLLANFGRLGREMAIQIEESDALTDEQYLLPTSVYEQESYEELINDATLFIQKESPLTMLEALQTDMALLRNPDKSQRVQIRPEDRSIQVHVTHNRLREVQVLYNNLLGIIQRHATEESPICPGDILVMAPDIGLYAPFIRAVFGANDSLLDVQVMDLGAPAQSTFIQGFLHLISLPFTRWDVNSLLQLLEYATFQKRHGLSREDVGDIREWMLATGVRWGENAEHRNELLKRDHCQHGMVDEAMLGTWDYARDALLTGLIFDNHMSVDPLEGPLLGKWLHLIRSLRSDLKAITDGTLWELKEWTCYLRSLCDAYFLADEDSENSKEVLCRHLEAFQQTGVYIKEGTYPFTTIHHHLLSALEKPQISYQEGTLHAVKFCSLLPMRAIPAKVIAILGMEEGAYPREEPFDSLNLMVGYPKVDYSPSQIDFDRFLFLETLLSARRYFLTSYIGYSSTDGKEQPPSLLVTELLTYIDKAYEMEGHIPSEVCTYRHPYHAFDKSYFVPESRIPSFIFKDYLAAKAYYGDKSSKSSFIPSFNLPSLKPSEEPSEIIQIHLKELMAFARNPIKTYFNKTLGIYLESAEKRIIKNEEEFHLSALQSFILKKDALKQPVEHILHMAEVEGHLPVGAFKAVSVDKIKREILSLKSNMEDLGVSAQAIFEMGFSDLYQKPKQSENGGWQLPSLQIPVGSRQVSIVGNLDEVTANGLLAQVKDDRVDIVKVWPQFLVFCCLVETHRLPIASQLLMTKGLKGKAKTAFTQDPHRLLTSYLEYYFTALEHVSPLIPEWVPHLLTQNSEEFAAKVRNDLTNPFNPIYNDYLHWSMQDNAIDDADELVARWKPVVQDLFGALYSHWFPRREL